MCNSRSGKNRNWYESYHEKKRPYQKRDTSHKIIYQIDIEGKIVKQWENSNRIADYFKVFPATIGRAIKLQKLLNNFLFVPMLEYKSATNYKLLIKFKQNKLIKLNT
jgi:hypothetical protein